MKIVLWFLVGYSGLVQFIDSKKYRGIMFDEVFDYDLDKKVPSYKTYYSLEHLVLEQIDDDIIIAGGYMECIKSMDPNMPIMTTVRTQFYQNSRWYDGPAQLEQIDMCRDNINPGRFWYNVTKLWKICPPQKGVKWFVENQTLSSILNLPPLQVPQWRAYIKVYQGLPRFEKHLYGLGIQSKKYRGIMLEEILDYDLDKKVPSYKTYYSFEHAVLEHIDDDIIIAGGYMECIKSMDPNMPIMSTVRTQFYQNSRWYDGKAKLDQIDMCSDFVNPARSWYNVTKLWHICPPQKGVKWFVENQTLAAILDLPPLPAVHWRGYVKVYQGLPRFEKHLYGLGIQVEFIEI